MAKSKIAQDLTEVINAIDKIVSDFKKDTDRVIKAVKELKQIAKDKGQDEPNGSE